MFYNLFYNLWNKTCYKELNVYLSKIHVVFYTVEPGLYESPLVYNAPPPPLLFVPVRSFMF